jgi:hypothetical protein
VKVIIVYQDGEKLEETELDVPLAPVEDPSEFAPESLYPVIINIPGLCPNCSEIHITVCERKGFRMHDDGEVAVYHVVGVMSGS